MRSVVTARRLRVWCAFLSVYAVLLAVGGVVGGTLLATFHRVTPAYLGSDGVPVAKHVQFPYLWAGVGIVVGALVVATFVVFLADLGRLRADVVIEDRGPVRTVRSTRAADTRAANADPRPPADAVSPPVVPPSPPPPPQPSTRRPAPTGRRVRLLTDGQKKSLAAVPPPRSDEGWYPDPLDAACLRRWNGAQWTGEQQAIALPPRQTL